MTFRESTHCDCCGATAAVHAALMASCAACLSRLCSSAMSSEWATWFSFERPTPRDFTSVLTFDQSDAPTRADLAVAFRDMGLHNDAVAEAVIAIANDPTQCSKVGSLVLGALAPGARNVFRNVAGVRPL